MIENPDKLDGAIDGAIDGVKIDELDSMSFAKSGITGVCKSASVWGTKKAVTYPLFYLRKPKWMPEETYRELLDRLDIRISLLKRR